MFNRKSSYALNKKDPNAIVYMDANEAIIRLTREDFASEEEFLKWKSLSDADYHASEKEDHVYANHTLALDELSEEAASIPAADVCMEQAHDRVAEIRRSTQKVTQIRKHLTDTQFRRMWIEQQSDNYQSIVQGLFGRCFFYAHFAERRCAMAAGEHVDSKNIKKHKNDVFRLTELIDPTAKVVAPQGVYADIQEFVQRMKNENVDIKQLGLVGRTKEKILKELKAMYETL